MFVFSKHVFNESSLSAETVAVEVSEETLQDAPLHIGIHVFGTQRSFAQRTCECLSFSLVRRINAAVRRN